MPPLRISRRNLLVTMTAAGLYRAVPGTVAEPGSVMTRTIPSSGESIPVVGMGSWITFNVGSDEELHAQRAEVLRAFFELGGSLVDSSPMYGTSEEVIGSCLARMPEHRGQLFAATKVWTFLQFHGRQQIAKSHELWGLDTFSLMQVHNLLDWEAHLETLRNEKTEGRLRYIGVTTSHGRRHEELEQIMRTEPLDFVQFTYNVLDRAAEARLLPLAADRGLAVIINRPFRCNELFERYETKALPEWAGEIGCANWAQFFLKFIISHPAVTCAIPATRRVDHMHENMGAMRGPLPDAAMRKRMVEYVESL